MVPTVEYTHSADLNWTGRNAGAVTVGVAFWPLLPPPVRQDRVTIELPETSENEGTVIEGDWGRVEVSASLAALLVALLGGGTWLKKRRACEE